MLKVVLIDDKKSIVEGMKYLIEWEKYGFEIAAALRCAADAISYVAENHVDLIISDIRMPGMSGLELIGEIRKTDAHIKFIIISGYAEFEYAKAAVDYQANGYLLKPVDEDELIALLLRVKEEIEEENRYIKYRRDQYISRMLFGDTAGELYGGEFEGDTGFRYLLVRFFNTEMIGKNASWHTADIIKEAFEAINDFTAGDDLVYVSKNNTDCIELIVGSRGYNGNIKRYCMEMESRIKEAADYNFIIFAGRAVDYMKDIRQSKESVKETERAAFYKTEKHIFIHDFDSGVSFSQTLTDTSLCSAVTDSIKNSDADGLKAAVGEFCARIKEECVNPDTVFVYIYNIIFEIGSKAESMGGDVVKFFYRFLLLKNSAFVNYQTVALFLEENALELQDFFQGLKKKNSMGIVGEIVDYLREHYMDKELKLQKVADRYYINSAYLGKMFKERVGMSFNAYLLNIRIDASKELLKNSSEKIYEIAEAVGFNDPNYFSVKFAEKVQMTPAAYRDNVK